MEHEENTPNEESAALRAQLEEREAELALAMESGRTAAERVRELLLASEPAIDPALVVGATAAEVEASFAAAKEMLERVRESVRKEQAMHIPAGAPGRSGAASAMSAFEKIRAGLSRS